MEKDIYILVVEDEPEVLDSIVRDIESFEKKFPIEMADSAEEAREIIRDIIGEGEEIGLILCDHILPAQNGVDLLIDMQNDEETKAVKKVLITGQAGLGETVKAVNEAKLQHYIAKPWKKNELVKIVKEMLTDYVIENNKDPLKYMSVLDQERLAEKIRSNGDITDT